MINVDEVLNWRFDPIEHRYDCALTMQYALAIGIGEDPMDLRQLPYVSEVGAEPLRAFPTMAVVLGYAGAWLADPRTGVDYSRIVHGEERLTIHAPLPVSGTVVAEHRVVSVTDKGAGKGAIITYDKDLFDAATGSHLATICHTTFARGDGGFSDNVPPRAPLRSAAIAAASPLPAVRDIRFHAIKTLPQQALLYRLCADRNPLHADPATAARAGFARPILHGLCTFGMAARAIAVQWSDGDADRLKILSARFSAPVLPGETLVLQSWRSESDMIEFRMLVGDRTVLSNGHAQVRD